MLKLTIGKAKFFYERWRSNVGIGQFVLTVYIAIKVGNFPIWLFIVLFVASVIYTLLIDLKYILPKENLTTTLKNPFMVEVMNKIDKIQTMLDKEKNEIK
jgi:hypothetical protein